MGIEDDTNSIALGFPDNIFQHFEIRIVVLLSFWLEAFPRDIESEGIKAPSFEISEIFGHKRVIAIKLCSGGMVWKLLIDDIDSVHDSDSVELISDDIFIVVYSEKGLSADSSE